MGNRILKIHKQIVHKLNMVKEMTRRKKNINEIKYGNHKTDYPSASRHRQRDERGTIDLCLLLFFIH